MTSKILRADSTEITGIKSVTFTEKVNADIDLHPGCVSSACIVVEVFGSQSAAPAANEALTYYQVDSEGNETLIGVFYAEPSIPSRGTFAFTAYDAVYKLNTDFSFRLAAIQENFPMTISELVVEACTVAGVTPTGTIPMGTTSVQAFYADGITCRQILSWAAEIACRFVRCDTSGNILFDWYTSVTGYRIAPGSNSTEENVTYIPYKQNGLDYDNYTTTALARVAVHPTDEEQIAYIYPTDVTSGNTLDISNNLLLTGADETVYMDVAQNIFTTMSALGTYRPAKVNLFTFLNPFRAGQVVPVTDSQGVSFVTLVMSMTVDAGKAYLESTGNKEYDGASNTIQEALINLADNIVKLKRLKVDWADIGTAVIQTIEAEGIEAEWINVGLIKSSDYRVIDVPFVYPLTTLYPLTSIFPSNGEDVIAGFAIDFENGQIYGAYYSKQIASLEERVTALENALTYPKAAPATLSMASSMSPSGLGTMEITQNLTQEDI